MKNLAAIFTLSLFFIPAASPAQNADPSRPDFGYPPALMGFKLVWNDDFNIEGKPDSLSWRYEKGFVRNNELQWYREENATCKGGVLLIEGKSEKVKNPGFKAGSNNWRSSREYAEYTSASIQTRGLRHE